MPDFMCLPLVELVRLADQSQGDNPLAEALARKLYGQDEALQHLINEKIARAIENFDQLLTDAQAMVEEEDTDNELDLVANKLLADKLRAEFPLFLGREVRLNIDDVIKAQPPIPKTK